MDQLPLSETLHLEGTIGQVQGTFSGTDIWHVNLVAEPLADLRLSPFFSVGVGKFKNLPNTTLVGALPTDAKLSNAAVGARYYLTDRFIVRADYTLYTVVCERHAHRRVPGLDDRPGLLLLIA